MIVAVAGAIGIGQWFEAATVASYRATRGNGAYTASKGGVLAMTRAAAIEYADRNIRVNALCPGVIETPLLANATDAARREVIQTIPMGRTGMPEEMARSEEHTSELQSLMRISYAVFCLKKKTEFIIVITYLSHNY